MTRLTITCETCGDVVVDSQTVRLFVPPGVEPWYDFVCPNCCEVIRKRADDRIVEMLRATDCFVTEPPPAPTAAAFDGITQEELDTFAVWLEDAAPEEIFQALQYRY